MNSINISETKRTPAISFDFQSGRLEISGYRSMPEVSTKFYEPVIDWIKEYIQKATAKNTVITFKLEYFNTSSGKCFVEILKMLDKLAEKGHPVFLKWYYEEDDEDMNISGDDMQASVKFIQMEKIPYSTES